MSADLDPDTGAAVERDSGAVVDPERVLRPLHNTTRGHWALLVLFGLGTLWMLFTWVLQLRSGLFAVTALGDWGISGGVPWGLYIGGFVWWIGVAHGGIAISAAVRVFKVERFRPIARIAEVLTVLGLSMAAANIVFSLGRADRVFNTIVQWPLTVHHSPLAWDIAVITLYLVLSLTYLTLSLRGEIYALRGRLPGHLRPVYRFITLGYTPSEREKTEQILWWLAVAILALVPLLSGGVVPWLFGLVGAQPGWYGAAAGPSMLVESLTSAMAFVVITIAAFRYAYDWHDIIGDDIFVDLTKVLGLLTLATIWFVVHDVLTGIYLAPAHVGELTQTVLVLPFFWLAVAGLVLSLLYFGAQITWPDTFFSIPGLVVASFVVAVSILNKKVMFIVEGLMHPSFPPLSNLYPTGTYFPSWVEWSLVLGSIVVVGLGFVVISKIIPMVDLEVGPTANRQASAASGPTDPSTRRADEGPVESRTGTENVSDPDGERDTGEVNHP